MYSDLVRSQLAQIAKLRFRRQVALQAAQLRGQTKVVADYLLDYSGDYSNLTVDAIAELLGVSTSTVRRTMRLLGIQRLEDLSEGASVGPSNARYVPTSSNLATPAPGSTSQDIPSELTFITNAGRTVSRIYDTFLELQGQLGVLQDVAQLLRSAPLVQIYGGMLSAGIGLSLHERLSILKVPSRFTSDAEAILQSIPLLVPSGVLFCVSLMGSTTHSVLRILTAARNHGVTSVLLTNWRTSPGAKLADKVITTGIADPDLHHTDLSARAAQLFALDVLVEVMESKERPQLHSGAL